MIAKIKGTIDELKPTEVILDVSGVGYGLTIPLSTYEKIQALKETTLYVYTHHKEDQFKLFGFVTENERDLFSILLNISGIGPAMAISILSGITVGRLVDAVQSENIALLTKIPGIGNTKAEKLIFELKRKMKKLASLAGESGEPRTHKNDAIEALVTLGFDDAKSSKIVDELVKKNPNGSIETIIKEALKILSA
ncbi:MAG TPA: Holliday junction branch migration protein RuvA [Spirochaetota bacterium]|nr:Holliday junction branch migration protein RuvA [Spirochaetota bacterium]HPC39549.1 Holliday junction branch migration protein RuvA [Spirochaetota bacterium]HQF06886.1 Holliday junction branch migration protein RuvA [Spirochaetota bacterium]HQH95495.1 Holliday junction branch migration protein RuvA [Spirochaetota bacterium]HQJ69073.1 Holliday junction branch migration protein RuvA [Spirochaetota bacterium]